MSLEARFRYEYPKLDPNWDFFILTVKIYDVLGLRPDTNDLLTGLSGTVDKIIVHTTRVLTADEKSKLDALMADSKAGLYPESTTGFTVFEISDLWDKWGILESTLGIKIKYMFCNVPDHTKLEIWVEGDLSAVSKKKLMDAYSALIKEKMA